MLSTTWIRSLACVCLLLAGQSLAFSLAQQTPASQGTVGGTFVSQGGLAQLGNPALLSLSSAQQAAPRWQGPTSQLAFTSHDDFLAELLAMEGRGLEELFYLIGFGGQYINKPIQDLFDIYLLLNDSDNQNLLASLSENMASLDDLLDALSTDNLDQLVGLAEQASATFEKNTHILTRVANQLARSVNVVPEAIPALKGRGFELQSSLYGAHAFQANGRSVPLVLGFQSRQAMDAVVNYRFEDFELAKAAAEDFLNITELLNGALTPLLTVTDQLPDLQLRLEAYRQCRAQGDDCSQLQASLEASISKLSLGVNAPVNQLDLYFQLLRSYDSASSGNPDGFFSCNGCSFWSFDQEGFEAGMPGANPEHVTGLEMNGVIINELLLSTAFATHLAAMPLHLGMTAKLQQVNLFSYTLFELEGWLPTLVDMSRTYYLPNFDLGLVLTDLPVGGGRWRLGLVGHDMIPYRLSPKSHSRRHVAKIDLQPQYRLGLSYHQGPWQWAVDADLNARQPHELSQAYQQLAMGMSYQLAPHWLLQSGVSQNIASNNIALGQPVRASLGIERQHAVFGFSLAGFGQLSEQPFNDSGLGMSFSWQF